MNLEDELSNYIQVIWRYKWMIAACAIIASVVALVISLKLTPLYVSTATVRVASAPGGASDYAYLSSATRLSNTYVEIATSDISLDTVAEQLGLEEQPDVEVRVVPETELIEIEATNPDPARARDIANALAEFLVGQSMQLYGGDAPTAVEILAGQLEQAKLDLDTAVSEYDKALRAALVTSIPQVSNTQIPNPDLDMLERLVNFRQSIYSSLLQDYRNARTSEEKQTLEEQLKQAKIDLENSITDYNNAIRTYQPIQTPTALATPVPNPQIDILANLVGVRQQIYGDMLQKYETMLTNEQLRTNAITIAEPAFLPQKPDSPKIPLNIALSLAAGLGLGVILAFLFEAMDATVRSVEDIQAITALPILCRVPEISRREKLSSVDSPSSQAFDQLRARLILLDIKPKSATILITSPEPGTGKSTVAANLAMNLTQGGSKVMLVDMDFHRPSQHKILSVSNAHGLSNYIRGEIEIDDALKPTKHQNLRVATSGSNCQVPSDWFIPENISGLLKTLGQECNYVIVDAPALLSVANTMLLASLVDAVILVVARRQTERKNFRFALQQLEEVKAKITGVVMNKVPRAHIYTYYHANRSTGFRLPKFITRQTAYLRTRKARD